jgi:asparagine synthase (glutamine-hydrolysing)
MCGFVATAGLPISERELIAMRDAMVHRGPDSAGVFVDEAAEVGLAHRRLSIIDLSASGHQPLANEDGSVRIVYNGEVYNFEALRRSLRQHHTFVGRSDTEVLVHLYEERGPEMVEDLEGMFAFALWDARRHELIVARDPWGIKPVYYAERDGGLVCASEIKALLAWKGLRAEVNPLALWQTLAFLYTPGESTAFAGIRKLLPGHVLRWRKGMPLRIEAMSSIMPRRSAGRREHVEPAEVRSALREAVRNQMVADVPVGCFLSGGLDSSAVAACMAEVSPNAVRAYSVGYSGKELPAHLDVDRKEYIDAVVARYRLDATFVEPIIDPTDLLTDERLQRITWHLEEPVADAAVFNVERIAGIARQQGTPVLLCGHGADELFAGYRRHVAATTLPYLRHVPPSLLRLGARAAGLSPRSYRYANLMRAASSGAPRDVIRLGFVNQLEEVRDVLHPDLTSGLSADDAFGYFDQVAREGPQDDLVELSQYVDQRTYMVDQNLMYMDKMSMAHSIETRVPYLDRGLAELAGRMPSRQKLQRRRVKVVLKEAVRGMVPDSVIDRPKMGFGIHLNAWWRSNRLDDLLAAAERRKWFRAAEVRKLRARALHEAPAAQLLHSVLMMELWAQRFQVTG